MLWAYCCGLIMRENSAVDRVWSIAPVLYAWIGAGLIAPSSPRTLIAAALVTLWGA
jgi:steroid 5-alpha reductase family enzyme